MKIEENIPEQPFGQPPIPIHRIGYEPGVYFLLDHFDQVLYVGQSRCVARRIAQHTRRQDILPFSRVAWISCDDSRLLKVEAEMIDKYQPPMNDLLMRGAMVDEYVKSIEEVEF